ncbi:MAG: response regulator [Anaerolineae bacterium]|nr:response regulator [Anaerolineae bacterium]
MPDLESAVVLVVEDDLLNSALVRKLLLIAGVGEIVCCGSGEEVRDAVRKWPKIDLVLLDLQMPGEDGFSVYAWLREQPQFSGTRIVAASANVMSKDVDHAAALGFDGFLGKPFNFDRFSTQIARLLNGERVWETR